jgi:hypothetical protein
VITAEQVDVEALEERFVGAGREGIWEFGFGRRFVRHDEALRRKGESAIFAAAVVETLRKGRNGNAVAT